MSEFAVFHLNPRCSRCQIFADLEQIDVLEMRKVVARVRRLGWKVRTAGETDFHISCSECETLHRARKASRRVLVPLVQHQGHQGSAMSYCRPTLAGTMAAVMATVSRCFSSNRL